MCTERTFQHRWMGVTVLWYQGLNPVWGTEKSCCPCFTNLVFVEPEYDCKNNSEFTNPKSFPIYLKRLVNIGHRKPKSFLEELLFFFPVPLRCKCSTNFRELSNSYQKENKKGKAHFKFRWIKKIFFQPSEQINLIHSNCSFISSEFYINCICIMILARG